MQFEQCPQKSGKLSPAVPAVVGRSRQFIARASIRASVYLPDPCAPERITACGKRSRASISRRRWMVSELPAKSENGIKDRCWLFASRSLAFGETRTANCGFLRQEH